MTEQRVALDDGSLVDLLDQLVTTGLVADGNVVITLADVELIRLELQRANQDPMVEVIPAARDPRAALARAVEWAARRAAGKSPSPEQGGEVTMTDAGIYVFGIVTADHPCHVEGLSGVGAPGAAVWRVAAERTAAAVSAAPAQLRAKRQFLITHQEVLQRLWEQGPVLPMRFGVVAPDQDTLRSELTGLARQHTAALKQVEGCGEVNVKAIQDDELLVEQASADPALRRLLANGGYLDRLRLGEAVAAAIARRTTADASAMVQDLAPLAVRAVAGPPVQGCAMNSSFLVGMAQMAGFLSRVVEVQAEVGARYTLRVTGPMPPYSFTG